jgi:hypothetical protein
LAYLLLIFLNIFIVTHIAAAFPAT